MSNPKPQAETFSSLANSFKAFDIIDHAKRARIQRFEVEYLQAYPDQLERLNKFVKESQPTQTQIAVPKPKAFPSNLVTIPSSVLGKIEPFYISLLINGFKLSNHVIVFGASNKLCQPRLQML